MDLKLINTYALPCTYLHHFFRLSWTSKSTTISARQKQELSLIMTSNYSYPCFVTGNMDITEFRKKGTTLEHFGPTYTK